MEICLNLRYVVWTCSGCKKLTLCLEDPYVVETINAYATVKANSYGTPKLHQAFEHFLYEFQRAMKEELGFAMTAVRSGG